MENSKSNLYIVAIVGIIAVVAMVILVLNLRVNNNSTILTSNENLAGQGNIVVTGSLNTCIDSDANRRNNAIPPHDGISGLNLVNAYKIDTDILGNVSGFKDGVPYIIYDACKGAETVIEMRCINNQYTNTTIECTYGCYKGKCNTICKDETEKRDIYLKGVTRFDEGFDDRETTSSFIDGCANNTTLDEIYCDPNDKWPRMEEILCAKGCLNGACIEPK